MCHYHLDFNEGNKNTAEVSPPLFINPSCTPTPAVPSLKASNIPGRDDFRPFWLPGPKLFNFFSFFAHEDNSYVFQCLIALELFL